LRKHKSPIVDQSPPDADISKDEVIAVLGKLRSKKAPGSDGISAEPSKSGIDVLVTPSTDFFNHMFDGRFPHCQSIGVIHRIFKKGDINDRLNYRGSTICSSISKLYASLLDNRIHDWAESVGHRARGQAGFRRERGTIDNLFILRTLLDQRRHFSRQHPTKKTHKHSTCFVDFKKTFDSVPRFTLWKVLKDIGMGQRMLQAIQATYANGTACVQPPEGRTKAFNCNIRVKRGCPLSPNLFGLYLDELEAVLMDVKHDAPLLADIAVP
jgi:hypothetical protein